MFSVIRDNIGRSLLVIFLIKPTIDLAYFLTALIGGVRVGPLQIFAALMFIYLLRYRFQLGRNVPPFTRVIETFLALNVISLVIGLSTSHRLTLITVIDYLLRVMDSYLIYIAAFLAAMRYRYKDPAPFIKAIVIGSSVPVVANVIAVQLGFTSSAWLLHAGAAGPTFRMSGLYYDPGVLANASFYHLVFLIFLLHLTPARGRLLVAGVLVLLAMADLYLIAVSKSRACMVELALFGMVYLLLFQRGWGKVLAPIAGALVIGAALLISDINLEELFVRFDSDVAALEGEGDVAMSTGGQVSFGSLEGLGNNRVAGWAKALTVLLHRPVPAILFGHYGMSVAHSDYIDMFARNGLVCLLVYLIYVVGLALRAWRFAGQAQRPQDRILYFMALTLLICYLFYSLPFRPLGYTTTNWYMWAIIGLAMARSRLAPMEAATARRQKIADAAPVDEQPPEQSENERAPVSYAARR